MHGCVVHIYNGVDVARRNGKTMRASAKAPTLSPRWLHFNPARGQIRGGVVLETVINGRPAHRSAKCSFVNIVSARCVDGSHVRSVRLSCSHTKQLILGVAAAIAVRVPCYRSISAVEPAHLTSPCWIVGSVTIHSA